MQETPRCSRTSFALVAVDMPGGGLQLSPVEGPDDTYAWDTRIRKLAACCRHANTAPVSFYGLRKVQLLYVV